MLNNARVLQILPRAPGSIDGVGDYALTLAQTLLSRHGISTVFAAGDIPPGATSEFPVVRIADCDPTSFAGQTMHVILHYANYGYQKRGVPTQLSTFARAIRANARGRWITMFHELYASGPPWKSAFWLRPLQVKIARDMIRLSDRCFVTSSTLREEIRKYDGSKPVQLLPVMSNFGEPELGELQGKHPKRWAICGGTKLIFRSLQSFDALRVSIPPPMFPEELDVIGGQDDPHVRDLLKKMTEMQPTLSCRYHPKVSISEASQLLRQAAFAWLDYFGDGKVWPDMILKSGSFAACCAHAVIPVLAHRQPQLAIDDDALPGPFFVTREVSLLPESSELASIQQQLHSWYHRHAAADCTADVYARALT